MNEFEQKILFYSLISNNDYDKILQCINNNVAVNKKIISTFLKRKINYVTIFSENYPKIFLKYDKFPFVIYFIGETKIFLRFINRRENNYLFNGQDKYSYYDYKFIKLFYKKTKKFYFNTILKDDNLLSFLIFYFALKNKKQVFMYLTKGIHNLPKNILIERHGSKIIYFSFKLNKLSTNYKSAEIVANKVFWLSSKRHIQKWITKYYDLNSNIYFPSFYKRNKNTYNYFLNLGFYPININKQEKEIFN